MADLWVWADPHLDHAAIMGYCNRPFANVAEMNECLISNYVASVKPGDDVVFLGDYAFRNHSKHLGRLPGNKTFVFGNHDRIPLEVLRNFSRVVGANRCPGILELAVGKYQLVLSHYPLASWNGSFHGTWNVHGHCHGRMPELPDVLRMDAGVDLFNFFPVNFEVIRLKMEARIPAWRERMRTLSSESGDNTMAANKAADAEYVNAWRARLAADPAAFKLDYHQRYVAARCPKGCSCSRSPHTQEMP